MSQLTEYEALELLKNIDGKLLKAQRAYLGNLRHSRKVHEADIDPLEGLLALTDAIADFKNDVLGDDSALFT